MQPKDKTIQHEVQGKPWEVAGADLFSMMNSNTFVLLQQIPNFSN